MKICINSEQLRSKVPVGWSEVALMSSLSLKVGCSQSDYVFPHLRHAIMIVAREIWSMNHEFTCPFLEAIRIYHTHGDYGYLQPQRLRCRILNIVRDNDQYQS
jgi:hypothetical protein